MFHLSIYIPSSSLLVPKLKLSTYHYISSKNSIPAKPPKKPKPNFLFSRLQHHPHQLTTHHQKLLPALPWCLLGGRLPKREGWRLLRLPEQHPGTVEAAVAVADVAAILQAQRKPQKAQTATWRQPTAVGKQVETRCKTLWDPWEACIFTYENG